MRRHVPLILLVAPLLVAGCTTPEPAAPAAGSSTPTTTPSPTAPAVDYTAWQAGRSTPVADRVYPARGTDALDVLHYDLALDWAPTTRTLTGTATLRIRPTKDAPNLVLDFMPYQVDGVTLDDATVTGTVAKEKLTVTAPVVADKPVTLVVKYHGKPKTTPMPSHRKDVENLGLTVTKEGGLWTTQEPFGAFTWYPANDQPSDEALYDIKVTVPTGWTAIASGTPAGQSGTTFTYRSADPVATYLTTLAVGKYEKLTAKGPRGIPLTYWYRKGADDKLLPYLKKSPQYLAWLEKKFGPYPFPSGGVVVVDSASGMETQQMITMGRKIENTKARRDRWGGDLLHEYAHQWFGDSVTPTTWTDLWLNEGWAQYAQDLYTKETLHLSDASLDRYLRDADAAARKKLGPPGKPNPKNFAEGNVYLCPEAMLHEIHRKLGDKAFFALARAWVQDQRNTQQDRASFIAFVNKQTGRDFTKLINTWLDSKTTPKAVTVA
ncbi:M1 family peptidase [Micromonospora terminaliae]|uniref:Aminopeptidase N n=1 Tax=Micromonospora terminaliae TaxID=1914461 RepID=A0AAJ2ZCR7_9ACTN|nr:M1 family metallopeptidase [Micromonospora terminaliae]NES27807.1 M1 family metallopeptidase [Micromonospora terminaliae]QGL47412.1 M1 family peptidase [Micromonospora terminaliae]